MKKLLFLIVFLLIGCGHPLPPEAKNIKDLKEGWYTFEMNVEGKNRKFLYHVSGQRVDTITELREE